LYEAGVKGKLDVPVHGLALGAAFQGGDWAVCSVSKCNNDTDSVMKLVVQLVRRLPNAEPDSDMVRAQVEIFRGQIESILAQRVADTDTDELEYDEASTAKLFEEIKVMFQDLPSRIDGVAERAREPRAIPRMHPDMIHEMAVVAGRGKPNVGTIALVASSYLRDDLPWLYERGVELYRQSLNGRRGAASSDVPSARPA
jgi:hypothetical protein